MFEIIGLLIGIVLLFAYAGIVGLVLAGFTWLLIRKRNLQRTGWIATAFFLPMAVSAYLLVCHALLPGESLFDDIDQPLPHGYRLEGLGKMPEYAYISRTPMSQIGGSMDVDDIEALTVSGPFVLGQYRHGSEHEQAGQAFFIFDTRTSARRDLSTMEDLKNTAGHLVSLSPSDIFRSQEAAYLRQQHRNALVEFGPPTLLLLFFTVCLMQRRRRSAPLATTLYT